MIFLDTNIFLRYLVQSTTPASADMQATATALFAAVERGEETVTTSEVVLHEVCYVLAAKAHYALPASVISAYVAPLLRLSGFKLPRGDKRIYLRALEIWEAHPQLGFADAVVAVRSEQLGVPLATFDESLGRLPFVTRWQP